MSLFRKKRPSVQAEQKVYANDDNKLHMKSTVADQRSPTPCPGSRNSSADGTHAANQTMAHLKEEIVDEIKREVCGPMMEMLTKIVDDIQALKGRWSEITRSFSDVSCQTEWSGAYQDSATIAVINNDETVYDVPRSFIDRSDASMSSSSCTHLTKVPRSNNDEQSQLNTVTRMTHVVDDVLQTPALPPRHNPYPYSSPSNQGHTHSNILRINSAQTKANVVQVKPRTKSEVQPWTRVHQDDKRELIANTLQFYIEDVVKGLAYQTDKLLDDLAVAGCLTREECVSVKSIGDGKDHIRALLILMKEKDLQVLEEFMKHLTRYNKDIAQKIMVKVECSMQGDSRQSLCAVCKIEKQVDIKEIADSLWSVKAIGDDLYRQIIRPDSNPVEQRTLWKKVFHSFNCLTTKYFHSAKTKLLDFLSKIDIPLRKETNEILENNQGELLCTCDQRLVGHKETVQLAASSTTAKSVSADITGGDSSSITVIPVIQGHKRRNSLPTKTDSKVSEEINKPSVRMSGLPSRQDKCHSNFSIKPPLLLKRPLSIGRKSKGDLQLTSPTKCEATRKTKSMPDYSVYDIPSTHLTKSSDISKQPASNLGNGTQTFDKDDTKKDPHEEDSEVMCEIPPLPTKKNKYPSWKKADEKGPSYV